MDTYILILENRSGAESIAATKIFCLEPMPSGTYQIQDRFLNFLSKEPETPSSLESDFGFCRSLEPDFGFCNL